MFYVSAVLQLFLLPAIARFLFALVGVIRIVSQGDPTLMAGMLAQGIVSSLLFVVPAIVGVVVGFALMRRSSAIPHWYARFARAISWLWLCFVPVGTILAAVQWKLLKRARLEERIGKG